MTGISPASTTMAPIHGTKELADDGPTVRAEFIFLAVALTMTLLLGLAGVPALPDQVAGEGSDALRKGWLAQHEAAAQADSAGMSLGLDGAHAAGQAPDQDAGH